MLGIFEFEFVESFGFLEKNLESSKRLDELLENSSFQIWTLHLSRIEYHMFSAHVFGTSATAERLLQGPRVRRTRLALLPEFDRRAAMRPARHQQPALHLPDRREAQLRVHSRTREATRRRGRCVCVFHLQLTSILHIAIGAENLWFANWMLSDPQ